MIPNKTNIYYRNRVILIFIDISKITACHMIPLSMNTGPIIEVIPTILEIYR